MCTLISRTALRNLRLTEDGVSGQRNDGVFWMEWHDFLQRFTRIDVLKARPHWPLIAFYDWLPCPKPLELWNCEGSGTWVSILLTQRSNRRASRLGRTDQAGPYDAKAHGLTDMSVLVCKSTLSSAARTVAAALSGPAT
eukprot:SAG31_NODE_12350_length_948_cov_0.905771_3_plen_138_part_01